VDHHGKEMKMDSGIHEIDWTELMAAFLHDPPDKALDIVGHESRALQYLAAGLGMEVSRRDIKVSADIDASIAERLAMPTAGSNGERAVGLENGTLMVVHPLSAERRSFKAPPVQRNAVAGCITELTRGIDEPQRRFLAIWRLLPERLSAINPAYAFLPADTRIPDHSIWNHLDAAAALSPSEHGGGLAFLSFALGPVQDFIAAARSVRDLWSGSMLLSWITFQSMMPVIRSCGPTALIYPSLRGLPWVDKLLREEFGLCLLIDELPDATLRVPSLPNRFLAAVPGRHADELARRCEEAGRNAWRRMAEEVRSMIDGPLSALSNGQGWSKRWESQVSDYFSFTTSVVCRRECREEDLKRLLGKEIAPDARRLADFIPADHRPGYDQRTAGSWQAMVEYSARLMEARRTVRHAPSGGKPSKDEMVPGKCSLMGSLEQMGPEELSQSAKFWEAAYRPSFKGIRIRPGERLCAVSMVKRFIEPAFFKPQLKLEPRGFGDTATVAAAIWLKRTGIDPDQYEGWNGQWLHWPRRDFGNGEDPMPEGLWEKLRRLRSKAAAASPPPSYYAVLMVDGDRMGAWLNGDKAPAIRDVLHPKLVGYFESLGAEARKALDARRPVGPAMHAAISQALAGFSVHVAPRLVAKHHGTLIYSGGDDLLALLPVETALQCAVELCRMFRGETEGGAEAGYCRIGERDHLMMGTEATLSAGLAVVHYKADLRRSLDEARSAEKDAKQSGRDALVIKACRRSGEHTQVLCPWSFVPRMQAFESGFLSGASDRFAYHLAAERQTLDALEHQAQIAEIKRQLGRSEPSTRKELTGTEDKQEAGERIARDFLGYASFLQGRPGGDAKAFGGFIDLLQTASFMARGRD
jgi:CRISPR-associated protein Cmr2